MIQQDAEGMNMNECISFHKILLTDMKSFNEKKMQLLSNCIHSYNIVRCDIDSAHFVLHAECGESSIPFTQHLGEGI